MVTGSSKGIGRSIAEAFAREGAQVVINSRNAQELEATAAEMRKTGGAMLAIASDVTTAEGARRPIEEAVKKFGTVHVLVNNAGGAGRFGSFDDLTDDEWMDVYNLNVLSAVRATRAAVPHMQKQKWGRIINISSESGVQPDAMMPHYNASKSALNSFTKSLSKAVGKDNILVNTVSPAFIRTPLLDGFLAQTAKDRGVSVDGSRSRFCCASFVRISCWGGRENRRKRRGYVSFSRRSKQHLLQVRITGSMEDL